MIKKLSPILSFLIGIVAVTSCADDPDLMIPTENESLSSRTNPLIEKAQQAYEMCYGSSSRSATAFYAHDIVPVTSLKSRAAAPDTVIYIVNEAEGNGFVALTGGDRPEILAVSDNGTINNLEDIDNPGLKMFFDNATAYAAQKVEINKTFEPVTPFPLFKEEVLYEMQYCKPRCETRWNQEYPEGLFCPNNFCGCTITATTQTLSYFQVPDTINLTNPDADKAYVNLNWASMVSNVVSLSWYQYNPNSARTPLQIEREYNLGRISRELGYRMKAVYGTDGTAASLDNMAKVVRQLCPTLKVEGRYYGAPIASKVLGDGIIIMQGDQWYSVQDSINNNHKKCYCHAWVVDGYDNNITYHKIYVYNSSTGKYEYSESESYTEEDNLQHINWGWGGKCNGFFKVNVFNTGSAINPDTNSNPSYYNFNHRFSYFRISPK